jgi:hypothetical protein
MRILRKSSRVSGGQSGMAGAVWPGAQKKQFIQRITRTKLCTSSSQKVDLPKKLRRPFVIKPNKDQARGGPTEVARQPALMALKGQLLTERPW